MLTIKGNETIHCRSSGLMHSITQPFRCIDTETWTRLGDILIDVSMYAILTFVHLKV